jgi:hypothetical protein
MIRWKSEQHPRLAREWVPELSRSPRGREVGDVTTGTSGDVETVVTTDAIVALVVTATGSVVTLMLVDVAPPTTQADTRNTATTRERTRQMGFSILL